MKLTSVFHPQKEVLTEGLKFGRKEIALVNKEAKNIRCGFEWEYHVNKEILEGDPEDFDDNDINIRADLLMHKDIQSIKTDWVSGFVDDQMDAYEVEDGLQHLDNIKSTHRHIEQDLDSLVAIEDEFIQIMNEFGEIDDPPTEVEQNLVKKYMMGVSHLYSAIVTMGEDANQLTSDQQLDMWVHVIAGGSTAITNELEAVRPMFKQFKGYAWDLDLIAPTSKITTEHYFQIKEVVREHGEFELYPMQQWLDQVQALNGNDNSWTVELTSHYRREGEEIFMDQLAAHPESTLGYATDVIPQKFWDQAVSELGTGGDKQVTADDYVDAIRELIYNKNKWGINKRDIFTVETEVGIEDGVETVSNPLMFTKALEANDSMLAHIRDVGWTDVATGLHINLSLKGMNFKRDNFNTSKLLLLLNPKMLQEFFGLREFVDDQFKGLTDLKLFNLAFGVAKFGNGSLIDHFEETAFDGAKHQQVNFNNFHTKDFDMDISQDRIEFRFVGGKDYEHRQKTIEWHIYRLTYLTMAAFSEGFAQKEYLKEMYKVLDRETKEKFGGMSFGELVKWKKKNPNGTFNDLNIHVTMGKRMTIDKKINRRR